VAVGGVVLRRARCVLLCTRRASPNMSGEGRLRRGKFKRGHQRCQVRAPNGAPHHSTREGVGAQLEALHASMLSGGHRTCAPDGE
jgi:hypothetical protein